MITPKELVGLLPPTFEPDYISSAVKPYLLGSQSVAERPALPLIDLALSKENAAPPHFWGMLYDGWAPNPEEEGVTVFIQGYADRGPPFSVTASGVPSRSTIRWRSLPGWPRSTGESPVRHT